MKYKVKSTKVDKEKGITKVIIVTKYGEFTGCAKCAECDRYDEYAGRQIAQIKANIKSVKEKRKLVKIRLKEALTIYNGCKTKMRNENNPISARVQILSTQFNQCSEQIDAMESLITEILKFRKIYKL